MKFLVTGKLKENPLLKKLVLFISLILMLFLISDIFLHHYQIGLTIAKATETILGNEKIFVDPILFDVLLERVHIDILISLFCLLIISSICISIAKKNRFKGVLIHTAFSSCILSHFALLGSFYLGSFFIYFWIILFTIWHLLAILMSISITYRVLFK